MAYKCSIIRFENGLEGWTTEVPINVINLYEAQIAIAGNDIRFRQLFNSTWNQWTSLQHAT